MTRIDFHSNVPDKILYACRLVRKARTLSADSRIVIASADRASTVALDEALWTFSGEDFLPHVMASDPLAATTPIILADEETGDLPHYQILINLSSATPGYFARFERMFEIISSEDADKAAGRERYRFYQQRGYPLTHYVAEPA